MALTDQIIGVESGGDPAAKNPRSSAGGLGQFIDSTWLATIQKHRPDLAEGKTKEELLALKSDPALSREMTAAYASENGKILADAGLSVTPGTTYLAHFAGPQGAVKVLQSDPSAPVAAVLGDAAVKANPFLQGMTAADLRAWADRKMGAPTQPATAKPEASQPLQVAPQQTPALTMPGNVQSPWFPPAQQAQAKPKQASPQAAGDYWSTVPVEEAAQGPPIIPSHRKPINLAQLRAAFPMRPFFFGKLS